MSRVVVAICTANREAHLTRLLSELSQLDCLRQSSKHDVQLLVVDNRPGGRVVGICDRAAAQLAVPVTCVAEPAAGISEARNRAVIEAIGLRADFIAFLDDDNAPEEGWLTALLARQSERNADIVVGNRVKEGVGRPDSRSGMLADEDGFWKPNGMPELMSTANVLIRVALLKRMLAFSPAFDTRFSPMGGEDADFFMRARKLGAGFAGARDSMVQFRTEGARATLAGRVMRKFKAGCAQAHLARRHLSLYRMSRWLLMLIARTLAELIAAPARVPFFSLRADCLSKLGAACGMWYGVLGGRVRYYTGQGLSE